MGAVDQPIGICAGQISDGSMYAVQDSAYSSRVIISLISEAKAATENWFIFSNFAMAPNQHIENFEMTFE